jgi:drug/metabolite transporter (DMT)-like permease
VTRQKDLAGIEMALAAAILFGLSTPLAKGLLRDSSPQLIAGLLYSGSGIGLALLAAFSPRREQRSEAKVTRRDIPWLAGSIFFGGIVAPVLLMTGLARTPASAASLLLNLEGALTAIVAWTVFKENVDRRVALGMALIVIGGAVLSWEGRLYWSGMIGPLAVVAACGCWAIDNNLTQKISAADPVRIAMSKGIVAGFVNVSLAIFLGARLPEMSVLALTALLGFASYGVSLVLFVLALRRLGTARTSAYFSAGPFVGGVVGLLLWREPLTMSLIAAALLMAVGLYLHITERHEHWHVHEPLEHSHAHTHDEHHRHTHSENDPPGEPHVHQHVHEALSHSHRHYPDIHHRHGHE